MQIGANDDEQDYKFPRPPSDVPSSSPRPAPTASALPPRVENPSDRISQNAPSIRPTTVEASPSPRTPSLPTSNSTQKLKAAPVGDDFFATFGV